VIATGLAPRPDASLRGAAPSRGRGWARATALAIAAASLSALPACGKRGDPLPPLRKTPPPVAGLRAAQRGDEVEISGAAPRTSVDGVPIPALEIEILRADRDGPLDEVGLKLRLPAAPGEVFTTVVPLPEPGTTVRIAARVLSRGGVSTRTPAITLTAQPPPGAPTGLEARLVAAGVRLEWQGERPRPVPRPSPTAAPPSASPAPALPKSAGAKPPPSPPPPPPPFPGGFWVYRRARDGAYGPPLSPRPVEENSFEDAAAPLGAELCYVVRAVAALDPLVESARSVEACIAVRDLTPPASPTGLEVLPREGGLEVSWSPSTDTDLAVYRLYRASGRGPESRLANVPATETTFLDADASPGIEYRYRLTALDQDGNESAPSAPAEGRFP